MLFETPRIQAFLLTKSYAKRLSSYYTENSDHLAPWEPLRPQNYNSVDSWAKRCGEFEEEFASGSALRILGFQTNAQKIAGVCNFTSISRGPFQACYLGYSIAKTSAGQGLMTEFVEAATNYAFAELDLHRIMANYVTENVRSARILEKLGFEKEGYAKSYLKIAGTWRDHVLTAKINPNHIDTTHASHHLGPF